MESNKTTVSEVAKFHNSKRKPVTKHSREDGEFPYYGAAGIQDYVSDYLFDGSYILVGEDGTVINDEGNPIVQIATGKFWVNNHAHVIEPVERGDFDYLYYSLKAASVDKAVTGAVQPKLSMTNLKQLEIDWLVNGNVRKVVGRVLSSLDDKIRLNTEISKTLEAIAQTIFQSWFIDFDPVHAKMRGEKPEGMDDATAALFPDSFDESELGMIPKGWEVEAFGEMVTLLMGQSPPGDTYNDAGEGLPFYQGKTDFGSRFPSRRMYCTAGKRIAVKGETLISVRAPVGDINQATEKCIIGRGVASALHKSRSEAYTFCLLSSLKPVLDFYNGEGSVFGAINGKDFSSLPIVEPPQSLVDCFNDVASPINDQIRNLFDEINNLISIRDALLPRLISGELEIPDEMLAS